MSRPHPSRSDPPPFASSMEVVGAEPGASGTPTAQTDLHPGSPKRHVLRLQVLLDPLIAPLPADPRELDSAKGRPRVRNEPAIQPNHPGFKRLRNTKGTPEITREDVARQPVLASVRPRDCLILGVE